MLKVSFIVPVYRVEAYIRQCVKSIIEQTYTNFEIILVDDGSPDLCPMICDQLAIADSRIVVIHKLNGGLSDARNVGLEKATGDYVIFVDSDDFWVDKYQLEQLMQTVSLNPACDFIGFNCSYYYSEQDLFKKWIPFPATILNSFDKNLITYELVASGTFPMSACLKVVKREFLVDNNIVFKVGILSEDIPWFIKLLNKSSQCVFVNQYIYAYRQNVNGSISNSFNERSFESILEIIDEELKMIDSYSFSDKAKDALMSFLGYEICILYGSLHAFPHAERKDKRQILSSYLWLLNYTVNPKVRLVNSCRKYLGMLITEKLLQLYMKHH